MKSTILSAMFAAPITFVADREQDQAGHQDFRCAFLVAIAAVLAVLPIMILGIPNGAVLPNHLRFALPFYEALQSGHLHPGWLAESNYGLGDLRFMLCPPGLYYLLSAYWPGF